MVGAIRVLHVDDDPQFCDLTATVLQRERERFTVDSVTDAREGQQRIADGTYDCIVSDYDMPELNGIEFLRAVREEHPDLPFILFTGKGSEEVASDAISAGVTDYLQKGSGLESFELLANRIENTVSEYRARRRAAETEQRLLELSEATNDVLWIFSAEWDELHFVNSAYEKIWGRSAEQLREEPQEFLEGIHPDDRERVQEAMNRLSDGRSIDIEYRVNEAEDYSRWVWVQGVPIFEGEQVVRIAGFSRDVTEHKRHENRLREEREFVEQTLDALNDTFYVFDTDHTLVRWNEQLASVTGYSEAELQTMEPTDFCPPEYRERIERGIEEIYETGETMIEAEYLTADGERVPFEFTGVELTDASGETVGFAGIGRDIAERKARKRELELYETIVNTIDDVVLVINENRRVELVNDPVADYVESAATEVEGSTVGELTECYAATDDSAEQFKQELATAFTADAPHETTRTVEVELSLPDGRSYAEYQLSPFTVEGERRVVVVARDVTERTERTEQLKRTNERLEEFASIVSHDLRNPLNVAELRLELARQQDDPEHLDVIERSLDRMGAMIEDLLMLARSEQEVDETTSVDLGSIAHTCWDRVGSEEATLRASEAPTVEANRSTIQQLLENLLTNAVEHGPREVTVEVGHCDDGFYVADDGPGIPEADREGVFETGYTTRDDGLGLGLSIVEQIARAHGWEITVTESEDAGARFEFTEVDVVDTPSE